MSDFQADADQLFKDTCLRQNMLVMSFQDFVGFVRPQFSTYSTRMKIPCGSTNVGGELLPVVVSVSCPTDMIITNVEVWVQIGEEYPPIPALGQENGPIVMTFNEARQFVRKAKSLF
jgi:hypothetical protein